MMLIDHDVEFQIWRRSGRRTINISIFVDAFAKQRVFHCAQLRQAYVLWVIVEKIVNDDSGNLRATFGEFRETMRGLDHSRLFFKRLPNIGILWLVDRTVFSWRQN